MTHKQSFVHSPPILRKPDPFENLNSKVLEFLLYNCYKNCEIHQNCDPEFDLDKLLIIELL